MFAKLVRTLFNIVIVIFNKLNLVGQGCYYITFKITDVCTYNKAPGMLFFAYYDVSSDSNVNDLEYSECDEILAQKWCKLY